MISIPTAAASRSIESRLLDLIDLHLHPRHGSAFWLNRSERLGLDIRREITTLDDLARLGTMTPDDLLFKSIWHVIPRALHRQRKRIVVGQTGGTTGPGAWTAFCEEDFHAAFIAPFEAAARHVGFPQRGDWLYIGPSGPHIIGKVVKSLARSMGSADPFSVDFDPRWIKKLPPETLGFARYLNHVVQQAMDVMSHQSISVLFTTPAVLARLAEVMPASLREAIRGVHYGGMALPLSALERFQTELFPNAVHLSGYGNTLFGCCLELSVVPGRSLDYFPYGDRLALEVLDDAGQSLTPGSTGQICFTRLDRSMLILRMRERDEAQLLAPPMDGPAAFSGCGVRNPRSPIALAPNQRPGLY